jgi:hypothetical protein
MLDQALARLKRWWLFAIILFVVIPAMEAAVWTLVGGFSHVLLIVTLALGVAALIIAFLAAYFETPWLKAGSIILVACFALFLGYAGIFQYQPATATQPAVSIKQEGTTTNSPNVVGNSNTVTINPAASPTQVLAPTSDPSVGNITQGPCSALQIGGSNNQASGGNCGPLPLKLTPSSTVAPSDRSGFVETIITITPNQDVTAPVDLVLDFDKPVDRVGWWIVGAGSVLGGGPSSITSGKHTVQPIGTSFNQQHPLRVTVYSSQPVQLTAPPSIK